MKVYELNSILAWCNCARSNANFWRRFIAASVCYSEKTHLAIVELTYLASGRKRKKGELSSLQQDRHLDYKDGQMPTSRWRGLQMKVSVAKRHEYWNHFVARWVVERVGGGHGVTGPRLRKVRGEVMTDNEFWQDVILRHGGDDKTPEIMRGTDPGQYEHCLGNFWGMVYQNLVEAKLV